MDFSDLSFEDLLVAMRMTPNLRVLERLSEEFSRFSPEEQKVLWESYHSNLRQFKNPKGSVKLALGKGYLSWNGKVPYVIPESTIKQTLYQINMLNTADFIEWVKSAVPNAKDIILDSRYDRLMNFTSAEPELESESESEGVVPEHRPNYIGRKTYKKIKDAVETFIPVPTIEEIEKLHKMEEEEIRLERELDEAARKKQKVPEDVVKKIASESKEEVKSIKRIIKPIPREIHDLYMRYIGVAPNYINQRAFAIFLKEIMDLFPNAEIEEILDHVDFGSIKEAIKERKKYSEYYKEALNDIAKRMGVKQHDVSVEIQKVDELNMRIDVFSKLLDLLFRIYSEYKREEDKDAQRAILRILCENFNICNEMAIETVRKDMYQWVLDNIDYLE